MNGQIKNKIFFILWFIFPLIMSNLSLIFIFNITNLCLSFGTFLFNQKCPLFLNFNILFSKNGYTYWRRFYKNKAIPALLFYSTLSLISAISLILGITL